MAYKKEMEKGIRWISVSLVVTRITRLLTTLVLARLLAPEMFGLVGMAHVTLEILRVVREVGFGSAFIQREDLDEADRQLAADTTFWMGAAINVGLFFVALALAPAVAAFFRSEEAGPILRVMFLSLLFDVIITVPSLDLQKRLEFKRLAICEMLVAFSYAVVGILLALMGGGVWSLVIGELTSKAVFAVALFRASTWRPRLRFSTQTAWALFHYGKYIWAFVLLSGIGDALDKLIVGRYYGKAELGLYSMAFVLCTFSSRYITSMVSRLTFPVFSRMQSEPALLRKTLVQTLAHVAMLSIPIGVGLLVVAPALVDVVLGPKWAAIVPLIRILTFYGMSLSIAAVTGPAFKAIGRPNVLLYTSIVHHTLKIGLLIALRNHGLIGICYAVLVPILLSSLIAFVCIVKYLDVSPLDLTLRIARPAVAATIMYVAVHRFSEAIHGVQGIPGPVALGLAVVLGVLVYIGASALTNRAVLVEFSRSFSSILLGRKAAA